MSHAAIIAENIGKKYILHHQQAGRNYKALRDVIAGKAKSLAKIGSAINHPPVEEFWALKDVSFEIKHGDVVGIVGRNGAGKSTLLKLLSRITEPTTGRIRLRGRVASLLEVGTGFHPELTGRENIFLNGAILGMSRVEITRKFDEIVAFAEVERFLDTPVKRYSSGMYVRLAFAVAAHLEPEILIVDEVLAVGDAEFQKKCLGKMQDVATQEGRTVLFVSHNMDAIMRLCNRAIHFHKGSIVNLGTVHEVVAKYTAAQVDQSAKVVFPQNVVAESVRRNLVLTSVEWPAENANAPWSVPFGEPISFIVHFECRQPVEMAELGLALYAPTGTEIASASSIAAHPHVRLQPGAHQIRVTYRSLNLVPNNYYFGLGLKSNFGSEDYLPKGFLLDVVPSPQSSLTRADTFLGYVVPDVNYVFA